MKTKECETCNKGNETGPTEILSFNTDLGHEFSLRNLLSSKILKLEQFSARINKSSQDKSGWSFGFIAPLGGTNIGTRSRRDQVPSLRHPLIMLLKKVARWLHESMLCVFVR